MDRLFVRESQLGRSQQFARHYVQAERQNLADEERILKLAVVLEYKQPCPQIGAVLVLEVVSGEVLNVHGVSQQPAKNWQVDAHAADLAEGQYAAAVARVFVLGFFDRIKHQASQVGAKHGLNVTKVDWIVRVIRT